MNHDRISSTYMVVSLFHSPSSPTTPHYTLASMETEKTLKTRAAMQKESCIPFFIELACLLNGKSKERRERERRK